MIRAAKEAVVGRQEIRVETVPAEQQTHTVRLVGVPVSTRSFSETLALTAGWAKERRATTCVTFANAHMLAVASRDRGFCLALDAMDLNCPDGRPLMWVGRYLEKHPEMENIPGPDFLPEFIESTRDLNLRHFFLGGAPGVAAAMVENLQKIDPDLRIAGIYSPPYRPLAESDLEVQAEMINESEADVVWVSLGCPKQEWWMHRMRHRLNEKVVFAVGQAFDLAAGRTRRAPKAARWLGMEWLYRLLRDPVRLATRYTVYNSIFLWQVIRKHVFGQTHPLP